MSGLAYTAAVILAAVFAWAAIAKLLAPETTVTGFAGLGVPMPRVAARLVPVVEVGLAGLLVSRPVLGAASALVLLAAFTIALVVNMGRPGPGCNCFGSSPTEEPVSWVEVIRNLFLAAGAVIATGATAPVRPEVPEAVLATTLAVLAAVVLGVLRLRHRLGRVWDNQLPGEGAKR